MPRLVVLNSCSGAAGGVVDLFSGTAAALVRGGVSAVAAMQYEISDLAAIARGRGVDDAISSGRVAIRGPATGPWNGSPVLYLRGRDARLFTLPEPDDTNHEGTQAEDTGGACVGQPGDTLSPGVAGGPRGDSPAWRARRTGTTSRPYPRRPRPPCYCGWRSARTGACSLPPARTRRRGYGIDLAPLVACQLTLRDNSYYRATSALAKVFKT
jgi:hypothetical protein